MLGCDVHSNERYDKMNEELNAIFDGPEGEALRPEERMILLDRLVGKIGRSIQGRLLVIVHTERGERIRIISARLVTKKERSGYEATEE